MFMNLRWPPGLLLIVLFHSWASSVCAQDLQSQLPRTHKFYFPYRQYRPLAGKEIGVLVGEAQPVIGKEGRSGPPDQLCFSQNGNSYRWVYVPAVNQPTITNLEVPIASKPGAKRFYVALEMASPTTVAPQGIKSQFTLVEVSVNDGDGSPDTDSFVASKIRILEGSKAYPISVNEEISQLKKVYGKYLDDQDQAIGKAMQMVQKKSIGTGKPNSPRQTDTCMYVTWNTKEETLEVRFRTEITTGLYSYVEGGARREFPLPLPPIKGGVPGKAPPPGINPKNEQPVLFPPPPPPPFKVKVGTTFGLVLGKAYIISKTGEMVQSRELPIATFSVELPVPPGIGRNPLPRPMPVLPGRSIDR